MTELSFLPPQADLLAFKRNHETVARELLSAAEIYMQQIANHPSAPRIIISPSAAIDNQSLKEFSAFFAAQEDALQQTSLADNTTALTTARTLKESADLLLKSEVVADTIANGQMPFDSPSKDFMNYSTQVAHLKIRPLLGR